MTGNIVDTARGGCMNINLCDNCIHEFATCIGEPVFGCDDGGLPTDDNVTQCKFYIEEDV